MAHRVTNLGSAFCIPVLSAVATFSQTPTPSRVADIYVGTTSGVYLYHAGSNGSLSLITPVPRAVEGIAIGSNHKYFASLDSTYLHAYTLRSDGQIMSQSWFMDTQSFSGSECGTPTFGVFDHSGQEIYVQLSSDQVFTGGQQACAAIQTYKIDWSGALTFLGATEFATETDSGLNTANPTPIRLSGNNKFAYSGSVDHECFIRTWKLRRQSDGELGFNDEWEFLLVPDTPQGHQWVPRAMTADPSNHIAVAMTGASGVDSPCPDTYYATQLASFTLDSDGTLSSTNTPANMPVPQVSPETMSISDSGELLAVGGTNGLQVFHFNGANPITPYSKVLTSDHINQVHWDRNQHLYALSNSTGKLYVYTVTPSSITAAPGSPYTIASAPNALSVAPVMCSAPASDGVHICDPAAGSNVGSPVLVEASGKVSGNIDRMELWVDGVKRYTTHAPQLDTTISLPSGKHHFSVIAVNTASQKWQNAVDAIVP